MATIEIIPIIVVFMLLFNYAFGFWGAIHSAILNSIAARNYAMATFVHSSNLIYYPATTEQIDFKKPQQRIHAINGEKSSEKRMNGFFATARRISFFEFGQLKMNPDVLDSKNEHNVEVPKIGLGRYSGEGVNPIWIKSAYGICVSAECDQ